MYLTIIVSFFLYFLLCYYKKITKNINLSLSSGLEFGLRIIFLFTFLIFFVIFFRFLNLFREKSIVDLNILLLKLNNFNYLFLFLSFICFIICIKIILRFFRMNFLKIHYYLMNYHKFRYFDQYAGFIYFLVTWHCRVVVFFYTRNILWFYDNVKLFYYFFKYFFTLIIIMLFFYDVFIFDLKLNYFITVLPWYSLYKLLYNMNTFLMFNLEYLNDLVITSVLYPKNAILEYRIYNEYNEKNFFSPRAPRDYNLEDDEFLRIRNYINNKLLK